MNCPHCGADMKFSPCCGRVEGLTTEVERLRAEVKLWQERSTTSARDAAMYEAEIERLRVERNVLASGIKVQDGELLKRAEQAEAKVRALHAKSKGILWLEEE